MSAVAYDPNNPVQQNFLSALALGESGGFGASPYVGYGGTDLSGYATDQYGFPQWEGRGNSHAAGLYQFQPGTWSEVASEHGLNFNNPLDQNAGAWYYAQDEYAKDTGRSLIDDLASGDFSRLTGSLKDKWTSVTGNAANPYGLIGALESGTGAPIPGVGSATNATNSNGTQPSGIFGAIENWFLRGGLIIVGVLIMVVAVYMLLRDKGYV